MKKVSFLFGIIILVIVTLILSIVFSPYFMMLMFLYFPLHLFYTESRMADEREKYIRYRAGYLTFQISIFLFIILFIQQAITTKTNPDAIYYLLVIFPIVIYSMFLLVQRLNLARSGRVILYVFGIWWILFAMLENGFTAGGFIQSSIGIGFFIPAILSYRFKKTASVLCFLYATFLVAFFLRAWKTPLLLLLMLFILPIPLYYAAIVFLKREGG